MRPPNQKALNQLLGEEQRINANSFVANKKLKLIKHIVVDVYTGKKKSDDAPHTCKTRTLNVRSVKHGKLKIQNQEV